MLTACSGPSHVLTTPCSSVRQALAISAAKELPETDSLMNVTSPSPFSVTASEARSEWLRERSAEAMNAASLPDVARMRDCNNCLRKAADGGTDGEMDGPLDGRTTVC